MEYCEGKNIIKGTLREVKTRISNYFDQLYTHRGSGRMTISMKTLKRGQKEVVIGYGRDFRYIVDFKNSPHEPPSSGKLNGSTDNSSERSESDNLKEGIEQCRKQHLCALRSGFNEQSKEVKVRISQVFDIVYAFDGYGEIVIAVRMLAGNRKEILIQCGCEYRYVIDLPTLK